VDGCFWHGHPKLAVIPKTNTRFWKKKISANKKRDRLVNATLRKKGWKVIRIWENEVGTQKTLRRLNIALEENGSFSKTVKNT
jgi:DNA mismatch endonuclease (patch repair protein)